MGKSGLKITQKNNLLFYSIILFFSYLAYHNSFAGIFLCDDLPCIVNGQEIRSLSAVWNSFPSLLLHISYKIGGFNVLYYHIISFIIHAINAILVFKILQLFYEEDISFLCCLIFAVHPVATEAVTWISGRSYCIMGLFTFLTILIHNNISKKFNFIYYLFCLSLFAYGLLEFMGFYAMLPVVLVIIDIYLLRINKTWKYILPYFLIIILGLYLKWDTVSARILRSLDVTGTTNIWLPLIIEYTEKVPFRWAYIPFSICKNFHILLLPFNLTFYYEPLIILDITLFRYLKLIALTFVYFLFVDIKYLKNFLSIFLLYVTWLVPTFFYHSICSLIAERYLYVPILFFCMFIALVLTMLRKYEKLMIIIFFILLMPYFITTIKRNNDYGSDIRFWQSTVKQSPYSHRAHNNLGRAYALEELYDYAIVGFKKSIFMKNSYKEAYGNLATVYKQKGRYVERIGIKRKAGKVNLFIEFDDGLEETLIDMTKKNMPIKTRTIY